MAPVLPLCQPEVRLTFPRQFFLTQGTWFPWLPPFCCILLLGGQHGGVSLTQLGEGKCPQKLGPGSGINLHALPVRVSEAAQEADLRLQQGN